MSSSWQKEKDPHEPTRVKAERCPGDDSVSRSTEIVNNPQPRPDILVRIEEYERYTTEIPDGIWKPAGPLR